MSGSTLRRTVLCLVVVALLLPLASAWAAPARGRARGEETARIQLPEWSRILLAPISGLMNLFRPATEADTMPPGLKPGNDGPGPDPQNREGSGFDPHGKP
jgi:hypothetical protein